MKEIQALRFVDRDGKKRLQMATRTEIDPYGDIVPAGWVDVPYVPACEEVPES